jgi:hypothetical protein
MHRSLVFALRARNVDALTAAEANMIKREGNDHLPAASAIGRTLFTHNTAECLNNAIGWGRRCDGL